MTKTKREKVTSAKSEFAESQKRKQKALENSRKRQRNRDIEVANPFYSKGKQIQ